MPPMISIKRFSRAKVPVGEEDEEPLINKRSVSFAKGTIPTPTRSVEENFQLCRRLHERSQQQWAEMKHSSYPLQNNKDAVDTDSSTSDDDSDGDDCNDSEDDFSDLTNTKFVSKTSIGKGQKAQKELEKEEEKEQKKLNRERKERERAAEKAEKAAEKAKKVAEKEASKKTKTNDEELFSKKGSELYGRDKLELTSKINQYKVLFPENKKLQALKLKKNITVEELQMYVADCGAIVETDTVEAFVTDSILHCLKMVEIVSSRTRYNIKGPSEMLRANSQFNKLARQLYIKYKVFGSAPPEAQMLLLVATTALVCLEKNKYDGDKQKVLNKTIDVSDL
jgi:hypothetical protein